MIETFGHMPDGTAVQRVRISGGGLSANILTYGATLQGLWLDGVEHSLVLGGETFAPYLSDMCYFGAMVGRVANRIGGARFELGGKTFHLDPNFRGRHTLHGGTEGFGAQLWSIMDLAPDAVTFALTEPDGHMGFPGEISVQVTYSLEDGALCVRSSAVTDQPTPCNIAHHSYFNLEGQGSVLSHRLKICADTYNAVDQDLIPRGFPLDVTGTAFDFREERVIGDHGYDHNFCLSNTKVPLRDVAWLTAPQAGLMLSVATVEPGLQIYDAAHLPAEGIVGLGGVLYRRNSGLALETQNWPDAINQIGYPDCVITPDQPYESETRYRISRV